MDSIIFFKIRIHSSSFAVILWGWTCSGFDAEIGSTRPDQSVAVFGVVERALILNPRGPLTFEHLNLAQP
jgi:hypothetical protein